MAKTITVPHLTKFVLPLKAHAYFIDFTDTERLSSETECEIGFSFSKEKVSAWQDSAPLLSFVSLDRVLCFIFPWKLQKLVTGFRGLFKFLTQSISNSYSDTYSYSAFIIACHHIVKTWYKVFHIWQPDFR